MKIRQSTKIVFSSILSLNIAFANTSNTNTNISQNIIESASEGRKVIEEKSLEQIDINKEKGKLFYSETILNYIRFYQAENPRGVEVVGKTNENLLVKNVSEKVADVESKVENKEELAIIKGFCFITDEINVGKQPASLRSECQTNIGAITMFANLVNVNEKASLVADPKYIEKNGYRFLVKSAIVTNEEKTSYNIATFVNDRKLSEVGWSALTLSSDEFKTASNEYLKALEESKRKQEVQYATTTDGAGNSYMQPIQTTNTEKPDPLDYLIKGGINVVATSVKTAADLFKKDLPYLYQIYPKTKIWIDLQVAKNGEYVR